MKIIKINVGTYKIPTFYVIFFLYKQLKVFF